MNLNEHDYVIVPQNDLHQIQQIAREYEGEPSKGIAHGLQKDAIQNGAGARIGKHESKAYNNWRFHFELLKINGNWAMSFWDEGTLGLTGDILSDTEIEKLSQDGKLTPDQNLSRFLTRFESGGNAGAGSFGRGKLIFQSASNTSSIICDSFRSTDEKYIAFDRKIIGTQLKQQRKPFVDDEAKKFLKDITNGALHPLSKHGTRVTILDLKEEVVDAFKKSFKDDGNYSDSFEKMIEETWWEIIDKFGVKINLKYGKDTKTIKLTQPLLSIAKAEDNEKKWRIYHKANLPVVIGNRTYNIKELKLAVSPEMLDEDIRDIWIQRKRMKIGSIMKGIEVHHRIKKSLSGYVILDHELEELVLLSEGTTHYSFRQNGSGIRQIKETIKHELNKFQEKLGFKTSTDDNKARKDMADALKEINEIATELGLLTEFASGTKSKPIEISIIEFELPTKGSKRVEYNQDIGPISYELKNTTRKPKFANLFITAEQRGEESKVKTLYQEEMQFDSEEVKEYKLDAFQFTKDDFQLGEGVLIRAKVLDKNSGEPISQVSRMLWLGMNEPEKQEDNFSVKVFSPQFPRTRSRRVEETESIRNIRFKITNNTAVDVKMNLDIDVRRANKKRNDFIVLVALSSQKDVVLKGMADREFAFESVDIARPTFTEVLDADLDSDERRCDIYFHARAAEYIKDLNILQGEKLGDKKSVPFFIGIDPPGESIFKGTREVASQDDVRRSWYEGTRTEGYTFFLNIEHPSFDFADQNGEDVRKYYIREEMMRQAYIIAANDGEFRGIAEEFATSLEDETTPPSEVFKIFEQLIGKAHKEIG